MCKPKRFVLQLEVANCGVFKTLLQRPEVRVTICPTLGGACPETCVRPRFPPPVSYLKYEIYFDIHTHAPRVATEVDGRCLTFGKGTEPRSAVILLPRLLFLVLKRPQPEADHLSEVVLFNDAVRCSYHM